MELLLNHFCEMSVDVVNVAVRHIGQGPECLACIHQHTSAYVSIRRQRKSVFSAKPSHI
jgi:hypothetical protein